MFIVVKGQLLKIELVIWSHWKYQRKEFICSYCQGAQGFVWLSRMLRHRAEPTNAINGGDRCYISSSWGGCWQVKQQTKIWMCWHQIHAVGRGSVNIGSHNKNYYWSFQPSSRLAMFNLETELLRIFSRIFSCKNYQK